MRLAVYLLRFSVTATSTCDAEAPKAGEVLGRKVKRSISWSRGRGMASAQMRGGSKGFMEVHAEPKTSL